MSLAHCDKLFKKIAKSVDSQELSSLYQTLFTFYPLINYSIGRGSFYWRGRKSTISGFEFEQALKYPPTGLAKNGRLNNESEPCLYSATRIETVFRELGATEGDHIHLVGFRIRNSERLRIIAIGDLYHVFKTGYAKSVGSDPNNIIARQLNSYDPSVATQLLYADALLSDVLTDPDAKSKEYLQTRVLASEAYIKCGANAMFYPSAQDDAGMNLAILRDAYDNNTHVNCSQVIRINLKTSVSDVQFVCESGRLRYSMD